MQGSGYLLHELLLDRQFSQHLIVRLLVRFSLTAQDETDPDSDALGRGMAVGEALKVRSITMRGSKTRRQNSTGKYRLFRVGEYLMSVCLC